MPKKYNWDFVEDFENEKALDLYLLTQVQTSTEHSNINNCSICTSEHKMNSHKVSFHQTYLNQ